MNFYFVDYIGNNYGAYSIIGNSWAKFNYWQMENAFEKTLIHEVGHCFDLLHTFNMANECEHVVRSGPDYNAATSGDFVEDTPADPGPLGPTFFPNCSYNYNPTLVDCIGAPYENVMPSNFMGYNLNVPCTPFFTEGQFQKMRNYLARTDSLLAIQHVDNTVESLYLPFEAGTLDTNIISVTDNLDGTARVCRNYISANYRFQPGFTYEFPENITPDLTNYTTLQTPLVASPAFNCPVKILQLSNNLGEAPTVCRGVHCVDEPFRRGMIYATHILGSMNVTQEYLDEIEVKDPNLYNNLLSQYYYILKKETDSGAQLEKVFYKN
jgi:hypothetical protein